MALSLAALLIATASWIVAYRYASGGIASVSGLMLLYVFIELIFRPAILIVHLDTPFPNRVFEELPVDSLIANTLILVAVWCLTFALGALVIPDARKRLPVPTPDASTWVNQLAGILTLLALAGTLPLWVRYGGPSGLTHAIKVDRVGINQVLRAPASLGAYFAMAGVLVATGRRARYRNLAFYLICAGLSFSWGARDAAVYPLLLLVLIPPMSFRTKDSSDRLRSTAKTVAITICVVAVVAIPLRLARDVTLFGDVTDTIQDESVIRQASVAANLTQFDALMLVKSDQERINEQLSAKRFLIPLANAEPGEKSVSVTVARTFLPNRRAGWPTSPVGEWFSVLGLRGVVLGGLLSGILAGLAMTVLRWISRRDAAMAMAMMLVLVTQLAAGGIWTHTLIRTILWGGVLTLCLLFVMLVRVLTPWLRDRVNA